MTMGPYPLEKMRALARQGQVGRSHQISGDGGESWNPGASFPEIFAAGEETTTTRRSDGNAGSSDSGRGQTGGPPAETAWHYTLAGGDPEGPVPESKIRTMIELGTLGPRDQIWTEAMGNSWMPVADVPRFSGVLPRAPEPVIETGTRQEPRSKSGKRRGRGESKRGDSGEARGFNGAGLSGFICSVVAIVLLAIPCLVWVIVAESFFWIFNVVIPFTILSIVGLVLSVIGLKKTPRGMATTGTVLGVIALMLGVMAMVGWFMLPYRLAMQRRTEIDSFATDIKLEEKNLADALARYQKPRADGETVEEFDVRTAIARRVLGQRLDTLAKAYEGHVSATAKTSEFREAFLGIGKLRKTINEIKKEASAKEDIDQEQALRALDADSQMLKVLLDTFRLHERGEISLKQAEAKMTGR